jgi:hypothetical protein
MATATPNPLMSLLWFFIITTIYFIFKYKTYDPTGKSSTGKIYGGIYILLLIIGQYSINLGLTNAMCGANQWNTALFITLFPWLFIFGLLYVVLSIFPGWLAPFSNTFGYGMAKLFGLSGFLNKIMKEQLDLGNGTSQEASEVLEHIYSDKSLLINEINETNFDRFWSNMKILFKPSEYTNEKNKVELLSFVRLKNTVSEYIWYMLTGSLVTSVSYNYVVNKGCSQSVKELKSRRAAYEKDLAAKKAVDEKNKPKVYSTTE